MIIVWSCLLLKIPEQLITKAKITEQEFALSVLLFFNNTRKILLSTFVIYFLSPVSPSTFSLFSIVITLLSLSTLSPISIFSLWSLYFPFIVVLTVISLLSLHSLSTLHFLTLISLEFHTTFSLHFLPSFSDSTFFFTLFTFSIQFLFILITSTSLIKVYFSTCFCLWIFLENKTEILFHLKQKQIKQKQNIHIAKRDLTFVFAFSVDFKLIRRQ